MAVIHQLISAATVPASGGGSDSDAAAFITATGISDATIESAVTSLVIALKADGIWAKCAAIYPFVGGTSTTHSYNLKNTAAHQITWTGSVTHNANGITPAGGYGDTNFNPSTHATNNDTHLSVYSRTDSAPGNIREIGAFNAGASVRWSFGTGFTSDQIYTEAYDASNGALQIGETNSSGFFIQSRRSSTDLEIYKNGSSVGTKTTAISSSTASLNLNLWIGAANFNGSQNSASTRNLAFVSIGSGLTDTEAANFHTAVEAFQDALSRGVV